MGGLKNVRSRWGDALSQSKWDEFEALLAEYYRGQGFEVEHTGTGRTRAGFDGGIDLKLRRDGRYVVVQCKHWNAKQVPHNEVHQLIGVMATEHATDAVLVTSGEFTAYARDSAAKVGNIELIDGVRLRQMLGPLMPDPAPAPMFETILGAGIEKYSGDVVEALLNRVTGRSRPKSSVRFGMQSMVLKGLLTLACAFAAIFIFNRWVEGFGKSLQSIAARPTASQVAPVPPASPASTPTPPPAQQWSPTPSNAPPVQVATPEVRRTLSPYAPPPPRTGQKQVLAEIGAADEMMTPQELEEWKRKNAESMKVLEANTRELQR